MINKVKPFKGGFRFREFLGQPESMTEDIGIPSIIVIPLKQGYGNQTMPLVNPGDVVKAGQIIGINDDSISSPVHSSVNGTVEKLSKIHSGGEEINAVVIRPDGSSDWQTLAGSREDWDGLAVGEIRDLLYRSGVTGLDRGGIPSNNKSSVITPDEVENIIIHSTGSEPFNLSLKVLLEGKRLFEFIEGMKILKKAMPGSTLHLVLDKHEKKLLAEIDKLVSGLDWLKVYAATPKYPQGYDEMLVTSILGKRFPYGYSAANILVVVLGIQTILHAYDAVAKGKPLIEKTLALCGLGWKKNLHIKVRVGTTIEYINEMFLKDDREYRIIPESVLSKKAVADYTVPVNKMSSQLITIPENREREALAFAKAGGNKYSYSRAYLSSLLPDKKTAYDTNLHGEERPCILCSFCEEVCPVNIIPHLIQKYVSNNIIDERLMHYNVYNCIDCNLCDFVCPSKIKLHDAIKDGQEKLTTSGCDRSSCILPFFDLTGLDEYRGVK